MANKVTTVFEAITDKASSALGNFKTAISDAEGAGGKLKAGMASVGESVQANMGALAVAGGAALVSFGVKAVGAFTDTSKAAIDLSAASGLAVEDASRWIAVGDDYQVGADTLTSSIGKIGKSLDNVKWEKYGIATRDAGGQARNVNDILLDSLSTLSGITNETERARVGNELFGKGYAGLAPLIGHTKDQYKQMLGAVEQGQVITAAEADKAEKFRLAQDQLKDALKEVTLAVGQQVASLAPLITKVAEFIGVWGRLGSVIGDEAQGSFNDALKALAPLSDEIVKGGQYVDDWAQKVANGSLTLEQATEQIHKAAAAAEGYSTALNPALIAETNRQIALIQGSAYDAAAATQEATKTAEEYKRAAKIMADDVKRGLDEISGRWDALSGNINDDKSWAGLQTGFDALKVTMTDAWNAASTGAADAEQKTRDARVAVDDQKLAVIQYAKEVLNLPLEKTTTIVAAIDKGDLDRAEALLANLTRNRTADLFITTHGGAGYGNGAPRFATGGIVKATPGGQMIVAGEAGVDEAVVPLDGKHGLGGTTVNVYVAGSVTSERDLTRTLHTLLVDGLKRGELPRGGLS